MQCPSISIHLLISILTHIVGGPIVSACYVHLNVYMILCYNQGVICRQSSLIEFRGMALVSMCLILLSHVRGHYHRTRFRDSFCLASVFEMTV